MRLLPYFCANIDNNVVFPAPDGPMIASVLDGLQ